MANLLGLDRLPEELIRKIYDFADPEDRPMMAMASKRLYGIWKMQYSGKIRFHIQGVGEKMFSNAIKTLKEKKDRGSLTCVKFSKFNLNTHWARYWMQQLICADGQPSCADFLSVRTVEISCIVSDFFLARLFEAFPNLAFLTLHRCVFVKHPTSSDECVQMMSSNVEKLRISVPFYADPPQMVFVSSIISGLVNSSKKDAKVEYYHSEISFKRFVSREFCRRKEVKCNSGAMERYRINQ